MPPSAILPSVPKEIVPLLVIDAPAIRPTVRVLAAVVVSTAPEAIVTEVRLGGLISRVTVCPAFIVAVAPAVG